MSQEHNDESNVDSKSEYADILGLQFEELIVGLNVDGVLNVASILDIRKTRYSDKNKFFIIREIRNYMKTMYRWYRHWSFGDEIDYWKD